MRRRELWWPVAGALVGLVLARRWRGQDLRGRVALVTGGSRGLGFRVAAELAKAGCRLAICARGKEQLEEARDKLLRLGGPVYARSVDITDREGMRDFVHEVEQVFGRIDILVNNAGIIQVGPFEAMTLDEFRHCVEVDFWGTVYTTLAALPGMRRRRSGIIVNITSIGAVVAVPHLLPYSCAKAAARSFSEGLAAELGGSGVNILTVEPWLMRTGSVPYAEYKGRAAAERALFGQGQRPLVSISADRAARRIVRAIARGETHLTLGAFAKLARAVHAVAPGVLSRGLGQVGRLLPSDGSGSMASDDSSDRPGR